jgi:hypothetical protein
MTSDAPAEAGERRKHAVVLRDDLATWQRLNVVAFLSGGLASRPAAIGEPYRDASGREYLPLLVMPVIVLAGDADAVQRGFRRSLERDLELGVYIDAMFETGNDRDNRATVVEVATEELSLAGFAVVGPARRVDQALRGLKLHP